MKVNVYLPDELGERAKEADLNFSRMLRDAVSTELERREAMDKSLIDSRRYEVELSTEEGDEYIGRVIGNEIANVADDIRIFLTKDRRILAYNRYELEVHDLSEPEPGVDPNTTLAENLRVWLADPDNYIRACKALGLKAVIDL
jgi:hypothetical protein